jgi:hypothetical protein
MNQKIIYVQDDGTVAITFSSPEVIEQYGIEAIALKDVPPGKPFKIVNTSDIPSDLTFWEAWEADMSNPDGNGIGHKAWFAEQAAKEQA